MEADLRRIRAEIRPVEPGEVNALAALIAGFRDHLGAAGPGDEELAGYLPAVVPEAASEFCCAWRDGVAIGYTHTRFFESVWVTGIEAHLEDLFVVPSARRGAVGRSLLRNAFSRAQARGALRLSLNTNEGNQAGQALYRAEGMREASHDLYPGGREIQWVRKLVPK